MNIENSIVISLTLYKLVSLLVGLISVYMGYNLFVKGIWGQAGDLDTKFGDNKVVLKNAAPGTFFALFGSVIIIVTLSKGLEFNKYSKSEHPSTAPTEEVIDTGNPLPDEPPI